MFLNRFNFNNLKLLYKYFLESKELYYFSSITSIVALLEFLGISSLLIAVSILLGEKLFFLRVIFQHLKLYYINRAYLCFYHLPFINFNPNISSNF